MKNIQDGIEGRLDTVEERLVNLRIWQNKPPKYLNKAETKEGFFCLVFFLMNRASSKCGTTSGKLICVWRQKE